jgi:signal transduction histidine kinase
MKRYLLLAILFAMRVTIYGQAPDNASLADRIRSHAMDTSLVLDLAKAAIHERDHDSAYYYANKGLELARSLKFRNGEGFALLTLAALDNRNDDYVGCLRNTISAFNIYEKEENQAGMAEARLFLQGTYYNLLGDYRKALEYSIPGEAQSRQYDLRGFLIFPGQRLAPLFSAEIAQVFVLLNEPDSALIYANRAIAQRELFNGSEWNFPVYLLATIQREQGKYTEALANYRKAYHLAIQNDIARDTIQILAGLSSLLLKMEQPDSSILYASSVVQHWTNQSEFKNLYEAMDNMAQAYKAKGLPDSAVKYLELEKAVKDTLYAAGISREIQKAAFEESLKTQQLVNDQLRFKSRVQLYGFMAGVLLLLAVALLSWRNSILQKNAKRKVETAFKELKATQAQLIQSEKMASLGQLTAGIAHEIQNPLNFVNNFSEINTELADEILDATVKGDLEAVSSIAAELKKNQEKITGHGKRADNIVKSMLQHSRVSGGHKEPTDINKLVEEYTRLAYHGFRARNKDFNVRLDIDLHPQAGPVPVVAQDIGRVILNLLNNAFQAVQEKAKSAGADYRPTVSIQTESNVEQTGNHASQADQSANAPMRKSLLIRVADNGPGIADAIKDKIFQPFFTTKSAGEGTGLGLSLSYDIVKAHGGELKAVSTEGEGSSFHILLPISSD